MEEEQRKKGRAPSVFYNVIQLCGESNVDLC